MVAGDRKRNLILLPCPFLLHRRGPPFFDLDLPPGSPLKDKMADGSLEGFAFSTPPSMPIKLISQLEKILNLASL